MNFNAMEFTNAQEVLTILENSIGKNCELMVTGLLVQGTIEEVTHDEWSISVKCSHRPVQWGDDIYTTSYPFFRKSDGFGSAKHLKIFE